MSTIRLFQVHEDYFCQIKTKLFQLQQQKNRLKSYSSRNSITVLLC